MQKEKEYDRFFLGRDKRCIVSTDCSKTQLNNNILVVGGSGSGKTVSVILPFLLHMNSSNAIGVFTKSNLLHDAKRSLEHRGYNVYTMDFADPVHSEIGYDPLAYCNTDQDLKMLARCIVRADPTYLPPDPYWSESSENLLALVLRYVKNGHWRKGRTMKQALEILDKLHWKETYKYFKSEEDFDDVDSPNAEVYKEFLKLKDVDPDGWTDWKTFINLPDKTAPCVESCLRTPLGQIFDADARRLVGMAQAFRFELLLRPKTVLLLRMSPVNTSQHRLVGIFYTQAFKALYELAERSEGYRLPVPVHVLCDDFATGCHVQGFPELISIFREKGISATMLIQSETQLASIYGANDAATIINNCDTYIYLGGMDLKTCRNISERMNIPSCEVQSMAIGEEYFIRRGQAPIKTMRYDTFNDPVYRKEMLERAQMPERTQREKNILSCRRWRELRRGTAAGFLPVETKGRPVT